MLLLLSLVQYSDYYLNLQFERKIKILSPYLSDKQERELISKWVLMQNKEDYILINNMLYTLAQTNNVSKPVHLWR